MHSNNARAITFPERSADQGSGCALRTEYYRRGSAIEIDSTPVRALVLRRIQFLGSPHRSGLYSPDPIVTVHLYKARTQAVDIRMPARNGPTHLNGGYESGIFVTSKIMCIDPVPHLEGGPIGSGIPGKHGLYPGTLLTVCPSPVRNYEEAVTYAHQHCRARDVVSQTTL